MDGQVHDDRYKIMDDMIIYYKGIIYLVHESKFKEKVLQAFHNSPVFGNHGFPKAYRKVRERFSWKGLKEDVMCHTNECVTC
jgi:hypothetical protein